MKRTGNSGEARSIFDYTLKTAGGVLLYNQDGAIEKIDESTICLNVRYDLPESTMGLGLQPSGVETTDRALDIAPKVTDSI